MSAVFLLGVALMLVWAASLSTASADEHEEEAFFDDNKQCVISVIGFAPDRQSDLTDEQKQLIKEQCSRESESEKAASVALKQCVIDTVGFLPADMSELSPGNCNWSARNAPTQASGRNRAPNGTRRVASQTSPAREVKAIRETNRAQISTLRPKSALSGSSAICRKGRKT